MYFPILCVDNFYKNPDNVREFALSLDFSQSPEGNYPGYRTSALHKIDSTFVHIFCEKVFSLLYENFPKNWEMHTFFQKIYPYTEDSDSIINSGWTHIDIQNDFAGVIYLNKNADGKCGTSLYKPTEAFDFNSVNSNFNIRNRLYNNNKLSDIDIDEYRMVKTQHESMFEKTVDISNKFNRLILYDGKNWHKESNFHTSSEEDFRLTQVFFIKNLEAFNTPLLRCNSFSL